MTEYEAAALAVQQAALEIQAAALEIQTASLTVQWAQIGMSGLQALLIAGGLWLMRQGVRHRDRQHEETMVALQQQGEALRSVSEGIREMGEGMREMGEGIREMIARTRPA